MKEKLKMIQGGPYYWGVEKMNGGGKADSSRTMTLSFGCKCGELDRYEAKSALQRELYLLCEREGFETFENYMRLL